MSHLINLFMWGYQTHLRIELEIRAKGVFEKLGAEAEPKVFLVGLRRPGLGPGANPVRLASCAPDRNARGGQADN